MKRILGTPRRDGDSNWALVSLIGGIGTELHNDCEIWKRLIEITNEANRPYKTQGICVCTGFIFDLNNRNGEILDIEDGVRGNTAFIRNDLKIERFLIKAALQCSSTSPKVCE
jgi:hypothetical protein